MKQELRNLKFERSSGFYEDLRKRVDRYFSETGKRRRDQPRIYFKAAFMLAWFAASYTALVFVANTMTEMIVCGMLLALATSGVSFNIQHDANHNAISKHRWINRLLGMTLDMVGMSSYVWDWKHNQTHHYYTNISPIDEDLDRGPLGRATEMQPFLPVHRFQQYYFWAVYAVVPIYWQFLFDLERFVRRSDGARIVPLPRGSELWLFICGKVVFVGLAFAIPLAFHSWWIVLSMYIFVNLVFGLSAITILQLAHCAEETEPVCLQVGTDRLPISWAEHQLDHTVNFATGNRFLNWFLGGLNFQIEHHLFPKISHNHYRGIAAIVRKTCDDYGLTYNCHPSLYAAFRSHFRFLKRMGEPGSVSTL